MKRLPHLNGVFRYLLLLICVCTVSVCFLFLPFPNRNDAQQQKYSYYQYLSGDASDRSLAADELNPDSYQLNLPEINQAHFRRRIEAEAGKLPAGTALLRKRKGYSGKGYVGKLSAHTESAITFPVSVPQTQHYRITVCAAAPEPGDHALRVNDEVVSQFTIDDTEHFTKVTFYGIFIEKGKAQIAVDTIDTKLDIDYIELEDDASVYQADFSVGKSLCDPGASAESQKLYRFLRDNWGKRILTGQYVSDENDRELQLIYQMTGQLPAIRFSMLTNGNLRQQTEAAIDWNVYMHGIVGLMWQWEAPGCNSVYAEDTDFDLQAALRHKDMQKLAMIHPDDAERAVEAGSMRPETLMLLQEIDAVADALQPLKTMDIPVLWRPLHEAGGGWYWWGASGSAAYCALWQLLYYRMTDYHQLNNLIWIWNGQSAAYLVPEDTYDIASADIYLQPQMQYGSRFEQFLSLKKLTGGRKLLALSECSALPDPEMMQIDSALWSFFGLWYGDYLMNSDGTFSDMYYSSNDLYNLYNSEQAFTLNDFRSQYQ